MRRPGLTLVEVAIAIGVLLLVAGPAARMWISAAQADAATEEQTRAMILAQLVLESKVRVLPFDSILAASGTDAGSKLNWTLAITAKTTRLKQATVLVTAPGTGATVLRLDALAAKEN